MCGNQNHCVIMFSIFQSPCERVLRVNVRRNQNSRTIHLMPIKISRRLPGVPEQDCFKRAPHVAVGSETITVVPTPSLLWKSMAPLCASTMLLQMERPSPVPPVGREREASTR